MIQGVTKEGAYLALSLGFNISIVRVHRMVRGQRWKLRVGHLLGSIDQRLEDVRNMMRRSLGMNSQEMQRQSKIVLDVVEKDRHVHGDF